MEREKLNLEEAVGSAVKRTANEALEGTQRLGERTSELLGDAGESFRQSLPGGAKIAEAADAVSRGVKQTADYLQHEGVSGIVEDLEVLIRRYPLQTLMLGAGCGYLLSRFRPD